MLLGGLVAAAVGLALAFGSSPAGARQGDARLPGLFEALARARSPEAASEVESEIWSIWNSAGDPELDRLMQLGMRAMEKGRLRLAIENFSAVIRLDPTYAEGWNKRAKVYYQMRDYEASIRDVVRVLELEPRHFEALAGMGLIYAEQSADAPALRWFERAMRIHPHLVGVRSEVERLRKKLSTGDV